MAKKPKSKRKKRKGSLANLPRGMVPYTSKGQDKGTGASTKDAVEASSAPNTLLGQEKTVLPPAVQAPARNPRLAMADWQPPAASESATAASDTKDESNES